MAEVVNILDDGVPNQGRRDGLRQKRKEVEKPEKPPFQDLLYLLRSERVPVNTSEWIDFQTCLAGGQINSVDELYLVARCTLVKRREHLPDFDRVFGKMFYGIEDEPDSQDYDEQTVYDERDDLKSGVNLNEEEIEQKDPEGIEEVMEATSETSEDVHGGSEATKDVKDSPNAANQGEQPNNHGAEESNNAEKKEKNRESGGQEQRNFLEGGDLRDQEQNEGPEKPGSDDEKKKEGDGGKRLEKSGDVVKKGKGGFSAREQIVERRYDSLDYNIIIGYEQFSQALAKLTSVIRDASPIRTRKLDQLETAHGIARQGGMPEFIWEVENEEKPKVVVLFDVGGSTDEFRPVMEKLFSAARDAIDELEVYYFHNAIYGAVWPQQDGDWAEHYIPLRKILDIGDKNTKVIIVGDAWMSVEEYEFPYSFDDFGNKLTGVSSFQQIRSTFPNSVWINPIPEKERDQADNSGSIAAIREIFPMFDMSLSGLEAAVKRLMED